MRQRTINVNEKENETKRNEKKLLKRKCMSQNSQICFLLLCHYRFGPVCPQRLPNVANETAALEKMPRGRLEYLRRLLPYLQNQSEDCLYLNIYVPIQGKRLPMLATTRKKDISLSFQLPENQWIIMSFTHLTNDRCHSNNIGSGIAIHIYFHFYFPTIHTIQCFFVFLFVLCWPQWNEVQNRIENNGTSEHSFISQRTHSIWRLFLDRFYFVAVVLVAVVALCLD